jgi:hypothetical protein
VAGAANRPFYALLVRRLGARRAVAGACLHGLHYLTGAVSVPLGVLAHARAKERGAS